MFVGHYGASFAAKRIEPPIPLWLLFLAVQLLDVLWAPLVLLGIEKVRIVPGITASSPLDLYYMPYTHSLPAALGWAVLAGLSYHLLRRPAGRGAPLVIAAAVFSHWVLDLLVHRPDLPLYGNSVKMGLGLWNAPVVAFGLEAALLFGGMWLWLRESPAGRRGTLTFGVAMLAIQSSVFFGPPPGSDRAVASIALLSYAAFAAVIWWLQDRRTELVAA
jgi:hypothetical protein